MRLNVKGMAIASGLLWGGAVLCAGVANLVKPKYGREFLSVVASIYPGYHARRDMEDVALALLTQCSTERLPVECAPLCIIWFPPARWRRSAWPVHDIPDQAAAILW